MFSPKTLTSLLAVVVASAACYGGGQGAAKLSDQDVAAINKVMEQDFTQYMMADDWQSLGGLMKADAVIMVFGEPEAHGSSVILEALERNWGVLDMTKFEQVNTKVDGRSDLAYARGTYSLAVEMEGVPRISDTGKYLVILEKQADGAWLMSTINYSRNAAKPTVEDM